ncbi:unnamed protein product, partial [Discosporangium mesarthrocarpum]
DITGDYPATVYIGLGSNVGNRHSNLLKAYRGLWEVRWLGVVETTSFLYETPAMYVENQARFLNGACRLSTHLDPYALLERLKALEREIGRWDGERWGPRSVDLDILTFDQLVIQCEK